MLTAIGSTATLLLFQSLAGSLDLPDPMELGLPNDFAVARPATTADLEALAQQILAHPCRSSLLGSSAYRLAESQLACDAFLAFAFVNRRLAAGGEASSEERRILKSLLDDAVRAGARRPYVGQHTVTVGDHRIPDSVVYQGLVALMIAGTLKIDVADDETRLLFDELAATLVQRYAAQALLPSYGSSIWPCDNAIAVAALAVHGRLRQNDLSTKTAKTVARHLASLLERKRGFPTRVDEEGHGVEAMPRGSALAWTTVFLGTGGVEETRRFADALLDGFCDRVVLDGRPLAACREWPRSVQRGPDTTSGPIVGGYGVAASALAIAATRGAGLKDWHEGLVATGYAVGLGGIASTPRRYPLENAILAWAVSAQPW
jgi:hypothetical protein